MSNEVNSYKENRKQVHQEVNSKKLEVNRGCFTKTQLEKELLKQAKASWKKKQSN
jgi:hypothetical protein